MTSTGPEFLVIDEIRVCDGRPHVRAHRARGCVLPVYDPPRYQDRPRKTSTDLVLLDVCGRVRSVPMATAARGRMRASHKSARRCANTPGHGTEGIASMQAAGYRRTPGAWQDRFWRFVTPRDPDACWEWQGDRERDGYGRLHLSGRGPTKKILKAHRASYMLAHGEIPAGMVVRHTCDNPPCVNPAHLVLGTQAQNVEDTVSRGRVGKPPRGVDQHLARLTEDKVREIRQRAAEGETQDALAAAFGVGQTTISKVVRRETWRHVA